MALVNAAAAVDATRQLRQIIRENEIPDVGYVEQLLKMGADPNTREDENNNINTPTLPMHMIEMCRFEEDNFDEMSQATVQIFQLFI